MGQKWHSINTFVRKLIAKQHVFFVATAPLSADGHINVSPKGHSSQTFSIINDNKVAFLDMTGSGIETVSHVKENGRIVFMFCSFDESPCILRLWGKATVHERGTPEFDTLLAAAFPDLAAASTATSSDNSGSSRAGEKQQQPKEESNGAEDANAAANGSALGAAGFLAAARSIVVADVFEVASACGYAVPLMQYKADRDSLLAWSTSRGAAGLAEYRMEKNLSSLDGLQGVSTAADPAAAGAGKSSSRSIWGFGARLTASRGYEQFVWLFVGLVTGALLGAAVAKR